MDLFTVVLCLSAIAVAAVILLLSRNRRGAAVPEGEGEGERRRAGPRQVDPDLPAAARRRRRRMMRPATPGDEGEDEEWGEDQEMDLQHLDEEFDAKGKRIGVKKQRKLEMKAEKRAQREVEEQERQERKEREALHQRQLKKEEERERLEEKEREEEEKLRRELEEKREYEEYLKLKETFQIEEEGHQQVTEEESQSMLQGFIDHIKRSKVVILEELAAHFNLRTQEVIDRVRELQERGRLTGVIDDRGKFIYVSPAELQAVAKFIRQRGRVSISELAERSNQLINLQPDPPITPPAMPITT